MWQNDQLMDLHIDNAQLNHCYSVDLYKGMNTCFLEVYFIDQKVAKCRWEGPNALTTGLETVKRIRLSLYR